jgi:hypothetical protein
MLRRRRLPAFAGGRPEDPSNGPRAANVPSESIASPTSPATVGEPCAVCGAPLAGDQRYCLECGERRTAMSSVLLGGPPAAASPVPPAAPPGSPPSAPQDSAPRGNAVLLLAGIGVLLLAMGVGVLIGRAGGGSSKQTAAATPQVINLGTTGAAGSSELAFTDDWPSGKNGYTVQLQMLPLGGTTTSAVQAAKAAATAKGAKDVGALKSEDFASLTAGSYIVYSGIYKKKPEAAKALAGLKKSFPGAEVINVSSSGASSAARKGGSGSSGGNKSGVGSSLSHPAPPSVLKELHKTKGKSYEEKSKNLPDVVGT